MKRFTLLLAGLAFLPFLIGAYFYPQVPDQMPSHWNAAGEVDEYAPKLQGLFIMPVISAGLLLLFLAIPRIDPLKSNIAKFRKHYDRFVLLFLGFFIYIYMLTLVWTMGLKFNFIQAMVPAMSILFYYCGIVLEHAKRNWFVGIRTPWTLSSDEVWDRTHKMGGKLFKACSIIILAGINMVDYAIYLIVFPLVATAVFLVAYSYVVYQRLGKKHGHANRG